ncbi:hypothetical protein B0T17DRAFT_502329 [Bombardia bombarda]|uniref:F-box domain-containing protein n=1 Tax=Bombardia bombarda TaxID=252184 RepID=A0AA39XJE1_9PEZI|nr:hypothetical protein B0T17DRAFT_502329 [Bombardia bombarda]
MGFTDPALLQAPAHGMSWSTEMGRTSSFDIGSLPVELKNEILSHLDLESLISASHVNRHFRQILATNWATILMPILQRDFSPVQSLLRVFDVCFGKLSSALDELHDGDVLFGGRLLCAGKSDPTGLAKTGAGQGWSTQLSSSDGLAVFKVCLAVKKWELEFQRLRFFYHPEHSRCLVDHELERLRHGLYVWWRFARYFHGGFRFGEGFEDQAQFWLRTSDNSPDVRCNFVRQFSTTQLHEICDMWETIRSAVGREVCPSIVTVREQSDNTLSRAEAARIGWGDPIENDQILGTILKLRPEDILHLLTFRHRYATKASLVEFIRLKNPWIENSVETFSRSLMTVICERERILERERGSNALARGLYFPPSFPARYGGIVNYEEPEVEQLRDKFSQDAGKGTHYYIDDEFAPTRYIKWTVPPGLLVASS